LSDARQAPQWYLVWFELFRTLKSDILEHCLGGNEATF
jgi:hypothetical protein